MIAALLAGYAAAADGDKSEVGASFTEDLEVRVWTTDDRVVDNPDRAVLNYVEQVNRFNAVVSVDSWVFEAQIDQVALFANRYFLDDELVIEHQLLEPGKAPFFDQAIVNVLPGDAYLNLEKFRARYETKALSLALGDAYVAFGRGIGLNLNRNVDIDLDTSVQGVKTVVRPGAWDVTLVLGQINRQQVAQDNPNTSITGDHRHAVVAARAERFGLGPANIGGHVVVMDFVADPGWSAGATELGGPDVVVGGTTLELQGVAGLDIGLEGDVFGFPTDELPGVDVNGERVPGYALYLSTAAYPTPFSVLFEAKRYSRTERINAIAAAENYEVAVAPTLEYERAITEDSSATLNSDDIWGARLQIDLAAVPGKVIPYVATAVFRDEDLGGLHFNEVPETVVHPMIGVEVLADPWAVLFNSGVRFDDRDGTDAGGDRQIYGDVSVKTPLPGPFHLDVSSQVQQYHWGINPLQQADFFETKNAVTLGIAEPVAVIAYVDLSDNPLVTSVGNLSEDLYGAVEVQVKPTGSWTLKAFYGAYAAGIRCAGGQCRRLPGFDGARVAATGSF